MSRESIKKYLVFVLAVAVFVAADQWTKQYSQQRLATPGLSHIELDVDEQGQGMTVEEFLRDEFSRNTDDEISDMASLSTAVVDTEGQKTRSGTVRPDRELETGEMVEVEHREVVVFEDYWDFQYTVNPGAAFGLMADADEQYRKPFFIIVSLVAVLIIIGILRKVPFQQQILFWGLTLIAAGALGNFIDRLMFGYVIDFIVWKYTDEYRWPTFNIADVLICVGVGLMVIEIIRDGIREHRGEDDEKSVLSK